MKVKPTISKRKDIVSSALGSVRVEGLNPSPFVMSSLESFIAGKKTIEQIIEETKQRYAE